MRALLCSFHLNAFIFLETPSHNSVSKIVFFLLNCAVLFINRGIALLVTVIVVPLLPHCDCERSPSFAAFAQLGWCLVGIGS